MTIITELFLLLLVVSVVVWWCMRPKNNKNDFYTTIPGPPTIPLLGNALDLYKTWMVRPSVMRYTEEYGGIVKVKVGPFRKMIVVSDYQFVECILSNVKLIGKSDDYKYLMPWLGTGLLTSEGPKWKKHRRILTPAFHFQILEHFINVFESCGEKLVQKFEEEAGNPSVDIYLYVTLCSLDTICESIMGTHINAQDLKNSDYVRSVQAMCKIQMERSTSPLEMYDWLYPLTRNHYLQKKVLKVLHKQSTHIIQARRKELELKGQQEDRNIEHAERNKKPFIDLLLHATVDNRPLTDEEIREEVDTFMFEGHDTTASAISFTLYCLANNPQVQEKALEEQQALRGNNQNWTVTYEDLQNMKYLEQIIKETLRLFPSVPMIARRTNEEVKFNNTSLPKNDTLIVFIYGIHRNPKYFKDPEKFDPSRFANNDGSFPYSYIPFSAGSRNCIGQKFAMLEMKSIISKVLRKYKLRPASPEHELKLVFESILKSTNGIKISLHARK